MKKKLLTLAVALLAATGAWAQTTFTVNNLKYTVTDAATHTVELTGYKSALAGEVNIPATVTNEGTDYSVTSIGNKAFYYCEALTAVTIPASVTAIGNSAFSGCKALTAVTIPESVTAIGESAFYGCSALTSVSLPDGLTTIENETFDFCSALTSVSLPDGLTTIGYAAFSNCTSLTGITIPNTVTSIGEAAFRYSRLTTASIGSGVTAIGDWAFYLCNGITEMTVAATVPPTVGTNAFTGFSKSIPVYVPRESLAAYKEAEGWKEFTNLQAISTTGLQTPAMPESIRIYNGTLHNPQGLHLTLYDTTCRDAKCIAAMTTP